MAHANLNTDVLTTTCQFLTDVSDVLSFSLTCSSLRPIAIRRMLSMHPILLTGDVSVRRFHSFLFADAPARAPYVRAIQIDWDPSAHPGALVHQSQPEDASLLVDILISCSNLRSIAASKNFNGSARTIEAIGALQNLRTFSMCGWSEEPALLRGIRAPHRILRLKYEHPQLRNSDWWTPATLERVLRHLAPTLEELEVSGLTVDPNIMEAPLPLTSSTTQYPSVRSLTVGCLVGRLLLDHLHHLFPALCGTLSIQDFMGDIFDGPYAAKRAANKLAQDRSDPARAWKKLDRIVCNPMTFYSLALRCPIRLVMLRRVTGETRHFFADALRENTIPRLQLSLWLERSRGLDGLDVLDGLLPPELAERLTHLALVLQHANEEDGSPETVPDVDPDDLFDRTIAALRPLRNVTHLRLVVESDVCHFMYRTTAHSEDFIRAVRGSEFDLTGAARELVHGLSPSLRYVFLGTSDGSLSNPNVDIRDHCTRGVYEEGQATRGWRVAREEDDLDPERKGRPVLVELADAVVETIVWREELFMSEAEEVSDFNHRHGAVLYTMSRLMASFGRVAGIAAEKLLVGMRCSWREA